MNIFRLNKTAIADLKSLDSVEIITMKYSKFLNLMDFETGKDSNGISFHKKVRLYHSGQRKESAIQIFREGKIKFIKERNSLNINWLIKLDTLYFFSIFLSLLIGFLSNINPRIDLLDTVAIGLTICIILILIGILTINIKVKEINNTCLIKDF